MKFVRSSTVNRTSGLLEHAAGSVGDLLVDGAELAGVLALLLLERVDTLYDCELGLVRRGCDGTDLVQVVLLAASSNVILGSRHDDFKFFEGDICDVVW